MTAPHPELRGDHHVHSTFSDDATSTLEENIAAAVERGLTSLRMVEHVRATSTWVPEFTAAVARLHLPTGLVVSTGVEAKMLDTHGRLDVPAGFLGVDAVLVADHQFPGPDGPWTPGQARARLAGGLPGAQALQMVVDAFVAATEAAVQRFGTVQLAHAFSLLPKIGLREADLTDAQVWRWASSAAQPGVLVEVNEKWGCPGPRLIRAAERAGARLVAATDSHTADDVGRYRRVLALLDAARAP